MRVLPCPGQVPSSQQSGRTRSPCSSNHRPHSSRAGQASLHSKTCLLKERPAGIASERAEQSPTWKRLLPSLVMTHPVGAGLRCTVSLSKPLSFLIQRHRSWEMAALCQNNHQQCTCMLLWAPSVRPIVVMEIRWLHALPLSFE